MRCSSGSASWIGEWDLPETLSGGEQQRVAVCAAIAHRPQLLLADEPVGELDAESAATIYELLADLVCEMGTTALVVSHDPASAAIADRVVTVSDGRTVDERLPGEPTPRSSSREGGYVSRSRTSAPSVDRHVLQSSDAPAGLRSAESTTLPTVAARPSCRGLSRSPPERRTTIQTLVS